MSADDLAGLPNTDLLEWGTVFGAHEAQARDAVKGALANAAASGELVHGRRGWKVAAAAIAARTLNEPLDLPPGQTLLTLVMTERAETWIDGAGDARLRAWRERATRRILGAVAPPADVDTVIAPVRWLLDHAADGIELTQSGYIAPSLVLEAAERFDWWEWDKPPRSEVDVPQLVDVRAVAAHLRLVRRRGRTFFATVRGRQLLADPVALWRELARHLGGSDAFDRTVAEMLGHRLVEGRALDSQLVDAVGPVLKSLGWRTADGPLDRDAVMTAVWSQMHWWRILGLLDEDQRRRDRAPQRPGALARTALTAAGEATVLEYLRGRAVGPRHDAGD